MFKKTIAALSLSGLIPFVLASNPQSGAVPIWDESPDVKLEHINSISAMPNDEFKQIKDLNAVIPTDQMNADIDTLLNALKYAYSGRNEALTKDSVAGVIQSLEEMKASTSEVAITYKKFHQTITDLIQSIPDNHFYVLKIALNVGEFFNSIDDEIIDDTDKIVNQASGSGGFEEYYFDLNSGKQVAIFDIDSFMIDPYWVSDNISSAFMNENVSAVVINLVDNGGGSIGMVFEMWEHIQGGYNGNPAYFMIEDEINPMSSRLQFNQPFVFNSYYNSMLGRDLDETPDPQMDAPIDGKMPPLRPTLIDMMGKLAPQVEMTLANDLMSQYMNENRMNQQYLYKNIILDASKSTSYNMDTAIIGGERNANVFYDEGTAKWSMDKPLIIVTNERSASASELFVLGFENTENVYHVGSSSMGCLHYMNPSILWLKNSSMVLSVPTGLFDFEEDRSIEIKGLCPTKSTPTQVDLDRFIVSILKDDIVHDVPTTLWDDIKRFIVEDLLDDYPQPEDDDSNPQ